MSIWNPWHGCKKISEGCLNCYVYVRDKQCGINSRIVKKTGDFDLPLKKDRKGEYKLKKEEGAVYTCLTSDFFIEEADIWREECWKFIRARKDLDFVIITKRINRFMDCLPSDWNEGYDNVTLICTCENQKRADERLPIFTELPIKHKKIIHEPMLESIDISKYLATGKIEEVICGGESGYNARPCNYNWVLDTRNQCVENNVSFRFKQTGYRFVKDNKLYTIKRQYQQEQAKKAGIDFTPSDDILKRLSASKFRNSFHLKEDDKRYAKEKGMDTIRSHAQDFIEKRIVPEFIENDGRQTPMKGHPVFKAQHATATCCRGCIEKWHKIPKGHRLNQGEKEYIVNIIMKWIEKEMYN